MKTFWNNRYQEQPNLYGEHPNEYFAAILNQLPPGKLLLPGEGEGRNALYAAKHHWEVTAFDQSEIAQAKCLEKAQSENLTVHYITADAKTFPFSQHKFDLIALIFFHLPREERVDIHQKISLALAENGSLLIEGFGKHQTQFASGGPKDPEMLYDLEELKQEFPDIEWTESFDGEIELKEGRGHDGTAHVIRLLGKKSNTN